MRRWIVLLFLSAIPAFASVPCPSAGGTTDGGLVTFVCWAATGGDTACAAGELGSYSTQKYSALPTEARRCMGFFYNTADGKNNTNDTIIITRQGGNINPAGAGFLDWGIGFDAVNGTQPAAHYALVDGTAGKHFNVIMPQYTLSPLASFDSTINSMVTTFTINNAATFYPLTTPYILRTATGEQILVTTQTGTGPWNVTVSTRGYNSTTATSHTMGDYAWPADTSGIGGEYPSSPCDVVTLLQYLSAKMGDGTVPGRPDRIWLVGWSNGAYLSQIVNQVGKALATGGTCNSEWPGTNWTIRGAFLISTKPDMGAVTTMSTWASSAPSPYNVTADGSEPHTGSATTGPSSAGIAAYSTITLTAPYTITGLPTTVPNAAYLQAELWSPQFCQAGNSTLCGVTPDPNPGPEYINLGQQDTNVGGLPQHVFGVTTGIPMILVEQPNVGHTANFDTGSGCNTSGVACWSSTVIQAMVRFLSYGGPAAAPSGGSGASGGSGGLF